jgi:hypothetical protein
MARPGVRAAALIGPLDWPLANRAAEVAGWALHSVVLVALPYALAGPILAAHARLAAGAAPGRPASAGARAGAPRGGAGNGGVSAAAGAALGRAWRLLLLAILWPLKVRRPAPPLARRDCGRPAARIRVGSPPLCARAALLNLPPLENPARPPARSDRLPQTMAACWARAGPAPAAAMAAFGLLLLTGPWHLGRMSGGDAGVGALFPYGIARRPPGGGVEFYACADASLAGTIYLYGSLLPLTLWLVRALAGGGGRREALPRGAGAASGAGGGLASRAPRGGADRGPVHARVK